MSDKKPDYSAINILVVEDNPINMELIRDILQIRGYRVIEATDAQECYYHLERIKPKLILMDIQLPEIDGYKLTSKLKKKKEMLEIPIIAVTAYAMKGDRERALKAGCIDVITKPISIQSFYATIDKYIK